MVELLVRHVLPPTFVMEVYLPYYSEGNIRLYLYNEKNKLIGNQLGSLYRYHGINSDGSAWFLICNSLISQHSPSRSLCWQGDTGVAQSSQSSVKPLKNLRGKIKWEERLCCHACRLEASEESIPKRLQNLAKDVGPMGLVRPCAACSSVGTY